MKAPELKERLEESEKLIQEMTVTWEEKLRKTEEIAQVTFTLLLKLCCIRPFGLNLKCHFCSGEAEAAGESGHFSAVIRDSCGRG